MLRLAILSRQRRRTLSIVRLRQLLARHWGALLLGMLAGSAASIGSSFWLARALALDTSLTMSLVPRSITTPFAMPLAHAAALVEEAAGDARRPGGEAALTALVVEFERLKAYVETRTAGNRPANA